ncbi:CDC16 protein, partial [Coemansia sp. RSA 2607]
SLGDSLPLDILHPSATTLRRSFSNESSGVPLAAAAADLGWADMLRQRSQQQHERHRLVALTRRIHSDWAEVSASLRELRTVIAANGGVPVGVEKLRGRLWLAMLEVREIGVAGYARALCLCPSESAEKIDNDAFRTLRGDAEFRARVPTDAIVRVLNAVLSAPDRSPADPPRYVQGMNTLLAPFLYVLGEGGGFYAYRQFLRKECPLYARPSLPGVHACVQLVDECLAFVDAPLYSHLRRHGAVAKIYAFPAAMTLSASVGPLRQVVRLWDFLLAFGVHLNVVCIVAQLLSMRELLMTTEKPMGFLRSWPPLRAASVIRRTREIYDTLPSALRKRIKYHAHDARLAEALAGSAQVADPLAQPHDTQQPQQPQQTQQPVLKRELHVHTSSPQRTCSADYSPDPSPSRPRARTFSGLAKRLRMAPREHVRPLVARQPMPSIMQAAQAAQGSSLGDGGRQPTGVLYGALGLGLRTTAPGVARAVSGGAPLVVPPHVQTTRRPAVPQAAVAERMWQQQHQQYLPASRKLSG